MYVTLSRDAASSGMTPPANACMVDCKCLPGDEDRADNHDEYDVFV
jgi:hypothetical protein